MKILDRFIPILTLMIMLYVGWKVTPHTTKVVNKEVTLVGLEKEPTIGLANAPYTIVLFSDYSCPFCKKAESGVVVKIKELVAKGKVKYVFEDFPLSIHKNAESQANVGRCAWDVSSSYFVETQTRLFSEVNFIIPKLVAECVKDKREQSKIEASINRGKSIGITGTPSFIVGKTIPGGVKGYLFVGDPNLDSIK